MRTNPLALHQLNEVNGPHNKQPLTFVGTLKPDDSDPERPWASLEIDPTIPALVFASLKDQGKLVDVEPKFDHAHITVVKNDEAKQLIDKFGDEWKDKLGGGTYEFSLADVIDLDPEGWDEMKRVWFLQVDSPQLQQVRRSVGLKALPQADDGSGSQPFHVTFACRPDPEHTNEVRETVLKMLTE